MIKLDQLPTSVIEVISYIRRSRQDVVRERKTNEDTLTEQRELMKDLLQRIGFTDSPIFEEIGSGDSIDNRPVFKDLLKSLEKKKPNTVAIAVKEISRLGRGSMTDMGRVYDILRSKRIFIITPFKIYDPLNQEDDMQIQFYMFISRVELQMTKRRMTEARATYASRGKWMTGGGGIPFGYEFEPKKQILIPHNENKEIVKRIFEMYANERIGYNGISNRFKKEGLPSPTNNAYWHPNTIRRILTNRVYLGEVRFKQTQTINGKKLQRDKEEHIIVPNAHEAIIDENLFNKAQEILESNRNSPHVRLEFDPCELAGLIRCNHCGKKMVRQYSVSKRAKQDGSISTYSREYMRCNDCRHHVRYRVIEQELLDILKDAVELKQDELIVKMQEYVDLTSENVNYSEEIKRLDREKNQLELQLKHAQKKYLTSDLISDDEFKEIKLDLEKDIRKVEHKLKLIHKETSNDKKDEWDVIKIKKNIKDILSAYSMLNKTRRNELLRGVFDEVELTVVEKGTSKKNPTRFDLKIKINPKIFI